MQNDGFLKKSDNAPLSKGEQKGDSIERVENHTSQTNNIPKDKSSSNELGSLNFELWTVPIISLAKRIEEVFIPWQSEPILFEKWSSELMLLQKIRDEAHRFAINYNRSSREKSYTKTILDEIPGIWPNTRKKIFTAVSRVEELASWSYEKTKNAFGKKAAEALQNHGMIEG